MKSDHAVFEFEKHRDYRQSSSLVVMKEAAVRPM
jgi:hypothetical protein